MDNTIVRQEDELVAATVDSLVMWLDLAAQKPVVPPESLRDVWLGLARTEDFGWMEG